MRCLLSGSVADTELSTLELDVQGLWIEGSQLELWSIPVDILLGILELSGGSSGEDSGRLAWLNSADIVLEGYEDYPGAHIQIALYGVVEAGLSVGDSIDIVDASQLDGDRAANDGWQEDFRGLVDDMMSRAKPVALVSIALDRTGQSAALPALFVDGAFHASSGQVTITEAWSGFRELDVLHANSGGIFGDLSPVWFDADILIDGQSASIEVDCAGTDSNETAETSDTTG